MSALRHGFGAAAILLGLLGCNGAPTAPAVAKSVDEPSLPAVQAPAAAPKKRPAGEPQPTLPWGKVVLESPPRPPVALRVQVASTPAQRERGLMFREHMDADEGMMFVFENERPNSFWMHNTLIPLDMFFIKDDFSVLGVVENAEPLTDDPRSVPGRSRYVLETNAGFAREHGLGAGTKVLYTPPGN